MPNHCLNIVKGSKEIIAELYDDEQKRVTFNKISPMPESLHITSGGDTESSIIYVLCTKDISARHELMEKLKAAKSSYHENMWEELQKHWETKILINCLSWGKKM